MLVESLEDRRLLATFTVNTAGDAGTGVCSAGQCTTRDAVLAANAMPGPDTINFDPALTGNINLDSQLLVTESVTIEGPGAGVLTLRAMATPASEFRVIDIGENAGDVTIRGLTLTGGKVPLDGGGAIQFQSSGTLSIHDSVITGNEANNAGGIYSKNDGTLSITSSTISNNEALFSNGGGIQNVDGATTLTSSVVTGNRSEASGAGIFSAYGGSITITDSEITNNHVNADGYGDGGGIYSSEGAVTISGSTISGNRATAEGGGVYSYNGLFSVSNSTIENNTAGDSGGGISNYAGNLEITYSTVSNNEALNFYGGGIFSVKALVTLTGSTLSGNEASNDGGGIATGSGQVNVVRSLMQLNRSEAMGGAIATVIGGVTLTNSTISGNQARIGAAGIQSDSAPVRVVNSTVTLNAVDAGGTGGGGIGFMDNDNGESLLIHNSIVAGNNAPAAPDFLAPGNAAANLDVQYSLIGNNDSTSLAEAQTADANGNLVGTPAIPINPSLFPLANNGGPTRTHELIPGSRAIDAGNNALAIDFGADGAPGGGDDVALTTDGRGGLFQRSVNSGGGPVTDMGAYEAQSPPLFIVDTADDVVNGDLSPGDRSLRELISIANSSVGVDSILFAVGLTSPLTLDPALGSIVISDPIRITGPGADQFTIRRDPADPSFRLVHVTSSAGDVRISDLAFHGGDAGAGSGGAIHSDSAGNLVLVRSAFADNTADSGGAVAASDGSVSVAASLFSDNSATGNGGAIDLKGSAMAARVVDSTFSGNDAGASGGGIHSESAALIIENSTFTLNTAATVGGGVGLLADGSGESLQIENSILAQNSAASAPDFNAPSNPSLNLNVDFSLVGDNDGTSLAAALPDGDGNLIGDSTSPLDPLLGSLADNGGPTFTHTLFEGSPAIGAGGGVLPSDTFDVNRNGNTTEFLPTDQRGAPRVVDTLDMGAIELAPIPTFTWNDPADIPFGTLLSSTQLNATTTPPGIGTFTYTPGFGEQLPPGNAQTLSAVFTPNNPLLYRSFTATVMINVLALPVINSNGGGDTAAVNVAENTTAVTDVESTDADGDAEGAGLTYSLTGGADQALFSIDADFGDLAFIAPPDFENPGDVGGNNVYDVQVTVTDSDDLTDVQNIAVTVTNVNEAPAITSPAADSVPENQTAAIDVNSSDDSDSEGSGLTYTISGGADQGLFSITADTGVLTFNAAPDFENPADDGGDNIYDVQVTVTDSGLLSDVQTIAVTVTNVNEAPAIISASAVSVPENQTDAIDVNSSDDSDAEGLGLMYGISGGADQNLFSIDAGTGVLTFNTAPDFESPDDSGGDNVYDVQVTVTDSGALSDVQDIAVTVTDVNEAPTITSPAAASVLENQTGAIDVDSADDRDAEGSGLSYSISGGADQSLFSITAGTGVLTFNNAPDFDNPADAGGDNVYNVQVTVTDSGGLNDVQDIAVTVTEIPPALDFGDAPAPYPVSLVDNGASHVVGPLRLGANIDDELDGQPTAGADGDDANVIDDEDGVVAIADALAVDALDTTSSFLVTVSSDGRLDAWIDFDGDGAWEGTEKIADSILLTAGDNLLSYTVPAGSTAANAAARFRLSTDGNLAPTGLAADGEVEDYLVTILDGASVPDATVNLPSSSAVISTVGDDIEVRAATTTLFRAPENQINQIEVIGTAADDTVTIDFNSAPPPAGAAALIAGGLQVDGLAGMNTLVITASVVDLTGAAALAASNFQDVDLTDPAPNRIAINAAAVTALSPATNVVSVAAGDMDMVEFADVTDWLLADTRADGGDFIRIAENQQTGGRVELSGPGDWQNFVEPSDIDANGTPTAGDALLIINELGRRSFSDPDTGVLVDAATVNPWPGRYYDQNGDGEASALDALRVINRLAELQGQAASGESVMGVTSRTSSESGTSQWSGDAGQWPAATRKLVDAGLSTTPATSAPIEQLAESTADEKSWMERVDQLLADGWSLAESP